MLKTIRTIVLFSISLAAILALCEIFLRQFVPVRSVGSMMTTYDSEYGTALKPGFSTTRITPEFSTRMSVNSYGFRGSEPEQPPFRPILFLGDSYTFGYGVSDGEEFPVLVGQQLKNFYTDISIVNAGVGNSGNGRWVKFLENEGQKLNPRLIVLQIFENDFEDNLREKLYAYDNDSGLQELPVPPKTTMRKIQDLLERIPGLDRLFLTGLLRDAMYTLFIKSSNGVETSMGVREYELTYQILDRVLAICNNNHWPVAGFAFGLSEAQGKRISKIFESWESPLTGVPSRDESPNLYFKTDGHWNVAGHRFVADKLVRLIEAEKLLEKVD